MDLVSSLRSEILRPGLTLLTPGLIAGIPYVFVLQGIYPGFLTFAEDHPTLTTFLSFVASAVFGVIAQDIGSHIEVSWIDRSLKSKQPTFDSDWYAYLRSHLPERLVAADYINDRTMILHFELGMASALPISMVGTIWAWYVRTDFSPSYLFGILVLLVLFEWFFLFEARSTARMLAKLRCHLLKGFGSPANPEPS